jgi:peroxiredoxin Q/BCP
MKRAALCFMIFSSLHTLLFSDPLEPGSPVPQVKAVTDTGETLDLGAELAEGTTLVFFYPKAMTPGCTRQACSLRDSWDELQQRSVAIYGVSGDTAATQAEFREKHALPFTLLADTEGELAKAFNKSRWSRHAYIFHDGVLVWRDLSAATARQADEVLSALDELQL